MEQNALDGDVAETSTCACRLARRPFISAGSSYRHRMTTGEEAREVSEIAERLRA